MHIAFLALYLQLSVLMIIQASLFFSSSQWTQKKNFQLCQIHNDFEDNEYKEIVETY